jgi:hypothetical protein
LQQEAPKLPFIEQNNNRILPANARQADVAEKALTEIIPVQQRAYYSAFRVQGIEAVHYNRLYTGRKCNCQSAQKQINGILGKDGKADIGTINQMITGTGPHEFNVTRYNVDQQRTTHSSASSPWAPVDKNQGVWDIVTDGEEIPLADLLVPKKGYGDNGPIEEIDIDALVNDFDAATLGFSDVACPICFGTGYVGGFAPYHGHRNVLTAADVQLLPSGELDVLKRPFVYVGPGFNAIITLPLGAIGIDVFTVWNGINKVPATYTLDGTAVNGEADVLAKCDGKQHLLQVTGIREFTHIEMQFCLTTESVYFEFPKRPKSNNTDLLEQDEPFNIIMSPNVPTINSQDIIVEQQWGKVLVVQNVNPWNSRNRNVLGWEANVRVIQPQEIFRILPGRGRTMNKDATTKMVRDNVLGIRRT